MQTLWRFPLKICLAPLWKCHFEVQVEKLFSSNVKSCKIYRNLTRILTNCFLNIFSYTPKLATKFGNLHFLATCLLQLCACHLVVAFVSNTCCVGDAILVTGVPLFMWHCINIEATRVAFSQRWNNITAPQEPVTNNNFFLYWLWIISPAYCLVFACMDLHPGFAFTVTVKVKVKWPFSNYLIKSVICQTHKILFKIYDGIVKLFLRDNFVVDSTQPILSVPVKCIF